MKKKIIIILAIVLVTLGVAIGTRFLRNEDVIEQANLFEATTEKIAEEVTFPYTDNGGRIRYKLVINENEIETKNFPFKLNEEEKGSYYPLKDVLNYFNVEVLTSEDNTTLTSKINGNIIRVNADQGKMQYGRTTVEALDGNVKTTLVDNVLYVPSFFLMKFTDNTVVDYSSDGSSATLTTDLVVDSKSSGISGLSIENTASSGTSKSGGTANNGYRICSKCGGAGGYNEEYFDQYLVNGRWNQVRKYRWTSCSLCGGRGQIR